MKDLALPPRSRKPTRHQEAHRAKEQIVGLWINRPDEKRRYEDTLPFIEELERSRPDLDAKLRATNPYETIMNAIRFLTKDG